MGVVDSVIKYLGTPYKYGGDSVSEGGFDCSGLIYNAYKENNINIPRTAQEQYNKSTKIAKAELQKGDLIFTSTKGSTSKINHVLMYIGNNTVVESPRTGLWVRSKSLDKVSNIVGYGSYINTTNDKRVTDHALLDKLMGASTSFSDNADLQQTGMIDNALDKVKSAVFNIFKFIIIAVLIVLFVMFITKALDISIF